MHAALTSAIRLLYQRAAWETVLLLALLHQGLRIETAQTQRRASVPRPAARLVTKRSTASRLFYFFTSAALQEPFHLLKAHAACKVEKKNKVDRPSGGDNDADKAKIPSNKEYVRPYPAYHFIINY